MNCEVQFCDRDHEADDVRRVPHGSSGGAAMLCHEHYLEMAEGQVVPLWDDLLRQGCDAQMVKDAERAAGWMANLRAMHYKTNAEGFSLTSVDVTSEGAAVMTNKCVLDAISDVDDWEWSFSEDRKFYPFRAEIEMFDVPFFALAAYEEAELYGCPQEVLDEFDANS